MRRTCASLSNFRYQCLSVRFHSYSDDIVSVPTGNAGATSCGPITTGHRRTEDFISSCVPSSSVPKHVSRRDNAGFRPRDHWLGFRQHHGYEQCPYSGTTCDGCHLKSARLASPLITPSTASRLQSGQSDSVRLVTPVAIWARSQLLGNGLAALDG